MDIYNKKNHISRIFIYFSMLLFTMCLSMYMLLCSTYNHYASLDKTTVIEKWTTSENITPDDAGENAACSKASFLSKNASYTETILKNICSILLISAIPKGISLLFFLIIVFLFFFLALFILLPDEWTLINQKVRLDN